MKASKSFAQKAVLVSFLSFASAAAFAKAQPVVASPADPQAEITEIVARIHQTNEMEIEAGKLAKKKGSTSKILIYGDQLISIHQKADEYVLAAAKKMSIPVKSPEPKTPQEKQEIQTAQDNLGKLQHTTGGDFDQAFLSALHEGHIYALQLLNEAHLRLPDSPLRSLVDKMIDVLKQNSDLA